MGPGATGLCPAVFTIKQTPVSFPPSSCFLTAGTVPGPGHADPAREGPSGWRRAGSHAGTQENMQDVPAMGGKSPYLSGGDRARGGVPGGAVSGLKRPPSPGRLSPAPSPQLRTGREGWLAAVACVVVEGGRGKAGGAPVEPRRTCRRRMAASGRRERGATAAVHWVAVVCARV